MPILRVGKPRRHLPRGYGGFNRLRPRTRLLIADQGHRRGLPGTMAGLAVFLKNRKHVFGESDWRRLIGGRCSSERRHTGKNRAGHKRPPNRSDYTKKIRRTLLEANL